MSNPFSMDITFEESYSDSFSVEMSNSSINTNSVLEDGSSGFSTQEETDPAALPVEVSDGSMNLNSHVADEVKGDQGPAGKSPYFNNLTRTWFAYDDDQKEYYDTGVGYNGEILAEVAYTGSFKDISDFKKLIIGDYTYNGTTEVTIPIYDGSLKSEDNETVALVQDSPSQTLLTMNVNSSTMVLDEDKSDIYKM